MMDRTHSTLSTSVHCRADRLRPDVNATDSPAGITQKRSIDMIERATQFYAAQLRKNPSALRYLYSRGINDQSIAHFRLGYAPVSGKHLSSYFGDDVRYLKETGLCLGQAERSVVARFRGRLLFPIQNVQGQTVGFGARSIGRSGAKYINTPNNNVFQKSQLLYRPPAPTTACDTLFVVEGYTDVVSLYQAGIVNTVSPLGTSFTQSQCQQLLSSAHKIVVCFDGDAAGRQATRRALEQLLPLVRAEQSIVVMGLPDGLDPDTLVNRQGVDAFVSLSSAGTDGIDALLDLLSEDIDVTTIGGKARLAHEARQTIAGMTDTTWRERALARLSDRIHLNVDASYLTAA